MNIFDKNYVFWRTVVLWLSLGASVSVANSPLAVFTADWCGPCRQFKQDATANPTTLEDYAVEYVDIDRNRELAKELGVRSVPTFILYDNAGKEVKRVVGYESLEKLIRALSTK